jgi:uncharacterized SAM-binding protein YcdF (DUF218 family)
MSGRWLWRLLFLSAAGGVLLGLCLNRQRVLPATAAWLDVGRPPEKADVIMLLNGDENTRPFAAAALVKGRWAGRVLVTKVKLSPQALQGIVLPEHENNRQVLLHCGVPDRDIVLLEGEAESTYDEAVALCDFLDSNPGLRVLVVTNGPHTRRARWVFSRVLGDRMQWVSLVSAPTENCQPADWWRSAQGFLFVVEEYIKLALYGVWYGWLGYGFAAFAGGLLLTRWICRWRLAIRQGRC